MMLPLLASFVLSAAVPVQLNRASDGTWSLHRNGANYFIYGAGGNQDFANNQHHMKDLGGNSIRTWREDEWDAALSYAESEGVTVCLWIWINPDQSAESRRTYIENLIDTYKDRASVLIWGVGSEIETWDSSLWPSRMGLINTIAGYVKGRDTNHPVMTAVADLDDARTKLTAIEQYLPNIDIIGINSFGGISWLADKVRTSAKPFILTEFGPFGQWEVPTSTAGIPNEPTSTEKAAVYRSAYAAIVESVDAEVTKRCLGSYVFLWGWKFEQTLTWFGMFYPDGSRLEAVEAISEKWRGEPFAGNRVPRIERLSVSESKTEGLKVTERIMVSTEATDADGDELTWEWLLTDYPQNDYPANYPAAIVSGGGSSQAIVEMPAKGVFLLYAVVRDGHGNAAFANQILDCSLDCEIPIEQGACHGIEIATATSARSTRTSSSGGDGKDGGKKATLEVYQIIIIAAAAVILIVAGIIILWILKKRRKQSGSGNEGRAQRSLTPEFPLNSNEKPEKSKTPDSRYRSHIRLVSMDLCGR